MPVTFSTHCMSGIQAESVTLNETRLNRLMSGDKREALYMGVWDRFCDFFSSEKKADVLAAFWSLMHPQAESIATEMHPQAEGYVSLVAVPGTAESINAFQQLRAMSVTPEAFVAKLTSDGTTIVRIDFTIRGESVREIAYSLRPGERIDLGGLDLRGFDLRDARLKYAKMEGVSLFRANMKGTDLRGAIMERTDLRYANMDEANMDGANLSYAKLNHAKLNHAKLFNAVMDSADLSYTDLSHANMTMAYLGEAILHKALLNHTILYNVFLNDSDLSYADLSYADVTYVHIRNTNLTHTRLYGATQLGVLLTSKNFNAQLMNSCSNNADSILWEESTSADT